ncbi:(trans)glycosidase-1 [Coleophoma cylindrospora]|uniref:alpha-glucosidase n=1 Tax=Coleophoma cylindrospora TaxID=1849047 RepID=A0A3D8SSN1_9HELO|nr:(trans)glycosidase-1 [Coleophoma cylindrospora]
MAALWAFLWPWSVFWRVNSVYSSEDSPALQSSAEFLLNRSVLVPLSLWFLTLHLTLYSYNRLGNQSGTQGSMFWRANFGLWLTVQVLCLYSIAQAQTATSTTSFRPKFTVPSEADNSVNLIPNINDPEAVDAQTVCPGYTASNVVRTPYGLTASLSLAGPACNVYGTDIEALNLTVEYQSSDRLHIEITPTYVGPDNSTWFEIPEVLVTKPAIDANANSEALENDLNFVWSNDPTFSFSIIRKSTGDIIFSTMGSQLVFENQFVEFASSLPENYNLYGLGEVIHGLRMGNNFTRTFWAADVGDPIDGNIYGDHPFYMDTRYYEFNESTSEYVYVANATNTSAQYISYSHGVYLRNAHGQEVVMKPENITWRTLGGNIDLYFYAGPTQQKITKSYQMSAAGLPAMQQYFTFGYHQCRWGYANWSELQDVVDSFAKFGIPLENIWTDIDYMNQYRDFENDQNTFSYPEGQAFLAKLHANGQHYIPIVDSAVYIPNPLNESDAYPIFDRGNATDSFMLNPDGSLYIGAVWPGYTVFPDWIGASLAGGGAFEWWKNELTTWHGDIPFDGIWIDMSEVSSFCVGSCGSNNVTLNPVHPPFSLPGEPGNIVYGYPEGFNLTNATEAASASAGASSQAAAASSAAGPAPATTITQPYLRTTPTPGVRNLIYPPYVIDNIQGALDVHAVSPNATHHGGTVEYDFHNLFGTQILNATYHGLLNIFPGKRPFIIGRSTFVGSGKWAGHWGGDNTSLWAYMFFSIPQALSFSLFGIPMFGVDTCGFNGNTDEELCNRWMQLSAFFPFYRNHNTLTGLPQEPYRWASVIDASKTAMSIRYLLLPYMYTLFYHAHETGSTVMRALAWEFPNEPMLASADHQFLLGGSLMITPVLAQGATSVNGVFPGVATGEVWYDWYNQSAVTAGPGENITIDAPLGHIPVYVRGGSILPTQEPGMTTAASRQNPWGLIAALSSAGSASGTLYVDDGESLAPNATLFVEFTLANKALYATGRGIFQDTNPLANVTIMGVGEGVSNVTLNGDQLASGWTWNETSQVLEIKELMNSTASGAWSSDWVLKWE